MYIYIYIYITVKEELQEARKTEENMDEKKKRKYWQKYTIWHIWHRSEDIIMKTDLSICP